MGDIFDLLIGEVKATHNFAKPYIALLEELCETMEIIYIEGNHDFNLKKLFKKVRIFKLQDQPLKAVFSKIQNKEFDNEPNLRQNQRLEDIKNVEFDKIEYIYLAHGDIFLSPLLAFALKSLRNKVLLYFLNALDMLFHNAIYKKIIKNQNKKNLFFTIKDFKNLAYKRILSYPENKDLIIEGHYHQNFTLNEKTIKYINLASFAYERSFFVVEFSLKVKFQEKKLKG
ncbi:UDP-2,3-diacylglucosamine hydrolase [Campylobacter sp. MIT 97-5078]|nr:UDP-2,3-diacylglucosamine hydrolase [Campylobacter sp. MIT 97-5078]KGI57598.1 UDP-2,3-diacylglucosamine hydrolase [Campylobacter sp. MIT 97-5078]KGI57704.1 UDP-2,3-diacylglucosamine hydrolase [Campylobacter sp. MIT 97-5078]TQR26663.1 UDP-2,3-diacylglucosamine hydrolase [Campylobacter sp. MIT 97-5078]